MCSIELVGRSGLDKAMEGRRARSLENRSRRPILANRSFCEIPSRGDPEPSSPRLWNPHPKSPCVGEERRAWSGSNTLDWITNRGYSGYCGQHTLLQGRSRMSRTSCLRVRLRPQYGAAMSAPSGANTAPSSCLRVGVFFFFENHQCPTMCGVGGLHKTTAPSTSDHRLLAASAATADGICVLPEKYRNLGADFRKYVSAFCGSTAKPHSPQAPFRPASVNGFWKNFAYVVHEGRHGS